MESFAFVKVFGRPQSFFIIFLNVIWSRSEYIAFPDYFENKVMISPID